MLLCQVHHYPALAAHQVAQSNDNERLFTEHLVVKRPGANAYRAGWPDFLVEHQGRFIGVEVKAGGDVLNPRQRVMFPALERAGIRCYVWHKRTPDKLIPWRRYRPEKPGRSSQEDRRLAMARESARFQATGIPHDLLGPVQEERK